MTPQPLAPSQWRRANLALLLTEIDRIRRYLLAAVETMEGQPPSLGSIDPAEVPATPSSLDHLCTLFGLTVFERDVLLLAVGVELDHQFGGLCAQVLNHANRTYPTLGLALAVLPEVDMRVFSDQAPLQRWRLIELGQGQSLAQAPFCLHPRVLCYLLGQPAQTAELAGFFKPVVMETSGILPPSQAAIATRLLSLWQGSPLSELPLIQLQGADAGVQEQIAIQACQASGWNLAVVSWLALLHERQSHAILRTLCLREAMLTNSALLIDCHGVDARYPGWVDDLHRFVDELPVPIILIGSDQLAQQRRPLIVLEVTTPTHEEQRHLWQTHLGELAAQLNGHLDVLVSQFNLNSAAISTACLAIHGQPDHPSATDSSPTIVSLDSVTSAMPYPLSGLWDFCRIQSRQGLDALAQRIETNATWDDLVLPQEHKETLKIMAVHLQHRTQVYQTWGFAERGNRGLGITALFSGQSGTGKTMAAEVMANALHLDLYRIDLSAVVSKYIGETEKNLQRIFDAAEAGGAILLFDEADALFGKRTEVKDSHDRHANVEVSYLLQRMEAYSGLAILTTNLKKSIDQAFLRRIQFILNFPFPDTKAREDIWQRIFPPQTPLQDLKFSKLASLNVAGGNIRSIALNAAFLAAHAGEPVTMNHLLESAKREYVKLERTLTAAETVGWLTNQTVRSAEVSRWPN